MRGTQISADFAIDAGMREWAEDRTPVVNIEVETEKFIDHHLATGKTMLDWTAAWRTWMRNALTFRGAVHYTQDDLQLKQLMAEYTAAGFRRAYRHENSTMYRFEYEHWKNKNLQKRDMGIVTDLTSRMKMTG